MSTAKKSTTTPTPPAAKAPRDAWDELPPGPAGGEAVDLAIGEVVECTIQARDELTTRFGLRARYHATLIEDGTGITIWEKADLRRLSGCMGKDVRIERIEDSGTGRNITQRYTIKVRR